MRFGLEAVHRPLRALRAPWRETPGKMAFAEMRFWNPHPAPGDGVCRITRNIEHLHSWPLGLEHAANSRPLMPGMITSVSHKIDVSRLLLADRKCIVRLFSGDHGVAIFLAGPGSSSREPSVRLRPAIWFPCPWLDARPLDRPSASSAPACSARRQIDEAGAIPQFAVNVDMPATLIDDAMHGRQAQPPSLSLVPWS